MPDAAGYEQIIEVLSSTSIFAPLDHADLAHLAEVCVPRHYRRGEYLMHQAGPGDRLIVIVTGKVKVIISSPTGIAMILTTLGPGETLGELAVFDGAPRSASVVALRPTSTVSISSAALLNLLSQQPRLLAGVLAHLTGTIRRLTTTASDLVFLDLGGRLAKVLLQMQTLQETSGHSIDHLTQSDLAAAIGSSRQATNKALQVMAAQGWIALRDGNVTILDPVALRNRASLSPG